MTNRLQYVIRVLSFVSLIDGSIKNGGSKKQGMAGRDVRFRPYCYNQGHNINKKVSS